MTDVPPVVLEVSTSGWNHRRGNISLAAKEGYPRKYQLSQHGYHRDSVFFSMIGDEWPAVRSRLQRMLSKR